MVIQKRINAYLQVSASKYNLRCSSYTELHCVCVLSSLDLYQIIGDNVDLKQKASQQTLDSTGADHHWFHMCAVLDRVDGRDLDIDEPQADITSLPLQTFLPSTEDCDFLKKEFAVLLSRTLVDKLHFLRPYQSCIPIHIPYQYSTEASKKSDIVSISNRIWELDSKTLCITMNTGASWSIDQMRK